MIPEACWTERFERLATPATELRCSPQADGYAKPRGHNDHYVYNADSTEFVREVFDAIRDVWETLPDVPPSRRCWEER